MSKKTITRHSRMLETLNIPEDRYEHIVSYVTRMIIDYNGNVADILKEIPLNLKGNERYFAIFIIGNSSSPSFNELNDEEKENFMTNIADELKISEERYQFLMDFVSDIIRRNIGKRHIPVVQVIKNIINIDFTDVEKDFIIYTLGVVLTSRYEEIEEIIVN